MLKNLLLATCLFMGASAFAGDTIVLTKDNVITVNDAIFEDTVASVINKAKELDSRIKSSDPIYLVLNTPGGSIDAGLEMIENLQSLRRPVHTISIFSASMGFQTVQGLGSRYVLKNGTLMSHRATGGFSGQLPGSLGTRYFYYLKRVLRLDANTVKRSKGKLTAQSYARLIADEYWCDGQDCVNQGVADAVVNAQCDKSLAGTSEKSLLQDLYMGHTVEVKAEYDNCPLNTNALKYTIYIDGSPLFGDKPAPAADKTATSDPYGIWAYKTAPDSPLANLSKEEVFYLNNMIKDAIKKRKSMEVIKGY